MYTIKEFIEGVGYKDTIYGNEELPRAVEQMALLAGEYIKAVQSEGKRATLDAGNWEDGLVFRVIGNNKVYKKYAIKV